MGDEIKKAIISRAIDNIRNCVNKKTFDENSIENFKTAQYKKPTEKSLVEELFKDITTVEDWFKSIRENVETYADPNLTDLFFKMLVEIGVKDFTLPDETITYLNKKHLLKKFYTDVYEAAQIIEAKKQASLKKEQKPERAKDNRNRLSNTDSSSSSDSENEGENKIKTKARNHKFRKVKMETLKNSKQNVLEWFRSFERQTARWSNDDKAEELISWLSDSAAQLWETMCERDKYNYTKIKALLTETLGPLEEIEIMQAKLRLAEQSHGETIEEYYSRILTFYKYWDNSEEFKKEAKAAFLRGAIPDIKIAIASLSKLEFQEILKIAKEREKDLAKDSGQLEITAPIGQASNNYYKKSWQKDSKNKFNNLNESQDKKPKVSFKFTPTCYYCGKEHFTTECEIRKHDFERIQSKKPQNTKKFCTKCKYNNTHTTETCYFLSGKNKQEEQKSQKSMESKN
jgi:hypothetical protein